MPPAVEPDLLVELDAGADPELAADLMWRSGATAVEIREPEGGSRSVVAAFPTASAARLVASELASSGARLLEVDPSWQDAWRAFAEPVDIGERLTVAPGWRDVPMGRGRPGRPGRRVLSIDPGSCFGSGSHPSTRLILAALDREPPAAGTVVLDAGCGSGILAVAAALLGAARVTAVDVDPAAVGVTAANAAANGVADAVRPVTTPLALLDGEFELSMVNVTAGVHAGIGPDVVRLTTAGGRILVAGLLPGQWRHVAGAYAGASTRRPLELEGWEGFELVVDAE